MNKCVSLHNHIKSIVVLRNKVLSSERQISMMCRSRMSESYLSTHHHRHHPNSGCQYTQIRNAGHAKWQNIMHTKMTNDLKKGVIRTKIATQIKMAIREGGSSDPKINTKLAQMIEIARNNQVPVENIQRVLSDSQNTKDLKIVPYALKGPDQSVMIVETETDNPNRTRQELSAVVKKRPFVVADVTTVMYLFQHLGIILCSEYNGSPVGEDDLDTAVANALEAGAMDVNLRESDEEYGTVLEFSTDPAPNTFYPVISALKDLNYKITYSQVEYVAMNLVELSDSQLQQIGIVGEKISQQPGVLRIFDNIA